MGHSSWPPALTHCQLPLPCSNFVKQGTGFLAASYPAQLPDAAVSWDSPSLCPGSLHPPALAPSISPSPALAPSTPCPGSVPTFPWLPPFPPCPSHTPSPPSSTSQGPCLCLPNTLHPPALSHLPSATFSPPPVPSSCPANPHHPSLPTAWDLLQAWGQPRPAPAPRSHGQIHPCSSAALKRRRAGCVPQGHVMFSPRGHTRSPEHPDLALAVAASLWGHPF